MLKILQFLIVLYVLTIEKGYACFGVNVKMCTMEGKASRYLPVPDTAIILSALKAFNW